MNKVFVLGSINCDLVISSDRFPQAGETIAGKNFFINSGGKGANQAVACSKLGAETYLIGAVGQDIFGQMCFRALEESGCSTRFVKQISGASTGIASIWVIGGENRILLDSGANFCLEEGYVLKVLQEQCREGDILVSQLEVGASVVEKAFGYAKKLGMKTVLNPTPVPAGGIDPNLLKCTDILVPNQTEAEGICGFEVRNRADLRRAALRLSEYGAGEILITLGKDGAYYYGKGVERTEKIFPVPAVDTTAAGDTTIGALAYRLASGHTVSDSMLFCAAASAIAVSREGAQQSIPTLPEVLDLLYKENASAMA